jgi:hypothetical protein
MRTLDVLGGAPDDAAGGGEVSDDQGARRYARLLVSEIKLYNEGRRARRPAAARSHAAAARRNRSRPAAL